MYVHKYVDQKGSSVMLAIKMSAESEESIACRQGSMQVRVHLGFVTKGRHHQKSKTEASVAPQKGLMSYNFFLKSYTT